MIPSTTETLQHKEEEEAVHKRMPADLNEPKQRHEEQWAKIPSEQCNRLIKSHRK